MRFLKLTFLILSFLLSSNTFAQKNKRKELEKQKIELQKEIKYVNSLLSENKKASKYSIVQVRNLDKKISIREGLIDNINGEITLLNSNIKKKNKKIEQLEYELEELKVDYARIINQTYKSRSSYNRIMFLLSSSNFNQALKRLKYMEQYTSYRKEQGDKIVEHSEKLAITIEKLENEKNSKVLLIASKESEKSNLESEKGQKEIVLSGLKKKNKKLVANIRSKQKKSDKLQSDIQSIIMEEIRLARAKALKESGSSSSNSDKFGLTAEAKALAVNFKSNKNKLPWPVERGVVVSKFGTHRHPTIKNITIDNSGVDIATNKGSEARSVFNGEVSAIIIQKGGAKTIIVQHGSYYTVYSNLSKIYIKKGQKVKTKQKIGEIYTDSRTGDTVLKFKLWVGINPQNPSNWIYKM